jgi:hypothetical protein
MGADLVIAGRHDKMPPGKLQSITLISEFGFC